MAKDLNKIMLIGRLGTDPEMRQTASGSPVTTFRMATSRQWSDSSGETREETEWFSVVAWDRLAETCSRYLGKGMRVYVEGRLQTRSWNDQQTGQTRSRTEVIMSDMIMLDNREGRGQRDEADEYAPPREAPRRDAPRREPPRGPARGGYGPPPPDIGDEDIPF